MTPTVAPDELNGLLGRVIGEYREMPGLSLTPAQAARLWGVQECNADWILRLLAATGFLVRSVTGAYVMHSA